MVAERNGRANANSSVAKGRETFIVTIWFLVIPQGGNKFAFKSYHNKFLVAEQDGSLNANSNQIGSEEEFQVTCNKE